MLDDFLLSTTRNAIPRTVFTLTLFAAVHWLHAVVVILINCKLFKRTWLFQLRAAAHGSELFTTAFSVLLPEDAVELLDLEVDLFHHFFGDLELAMSRIGDLGCMVSFYFVLLLHSGNIEINSISKSKPLIGLLGSQGFVHGETDHLEVSLFNEHVHDVEALVVELCLGLEQPHWHRGVELLISLEHLTQKCSSKEYEDTLLSNPNNYIEKENNISIKY